MRIRQLWLRPYRNFEELRIDLAGPGALIVGGNGLGKSNILESISYLSIGKSIRGARDHEVVPHGGQYFDIRGVWEEDEGQCLARVFYSSTEGKRVFLDGVPLPRVSELISRFQTVHFCPEDVSLVLRFSAQRRRLLDIVISQARPDYLASLQRYGRVLTQRNHYLRSLGARRAHPAEREVWNGQLAALGAAIRAARLETLVEMTPLLVGFYEGFSTGRERAAATYRERPPPLAVQDVPPVEELAEELVRELESDPEREERAGHTLCGPHRDGLAFTLDGEAADTFGSQGQLKGLLLSWKMAEARFLESRGSGQPVLLFDDVFSELDETRSRRVLNLTDDFDQVILTAPRAPGDEVGDRFQRIELSG